MDSWTELHIKDCGIGLLPLKLYSFVSDFNQSKVTTEILKVLDPLSQEFAERLRIGCLGSFQLKIRVERSDASEHCGPRGPKQQRL